MLVFGPFAKFVKMNTLNTYSGSELQVIKSEMLVRYNEMLITLFIIRF